MATITEDYVSFETAKLLKEKGFNEPCIWLYSKKGEKHYASDYHSPWHNNELAADEWSCCTQAVAMKWLREVYHIAIVIMPSMFWGKYNISIYKKGNDYPYGFDEDSLISSYEQACEAAIKYCLENLI